MVTTNERVKDESGQGLVEYALIIAIVSLGAVLALGFLSGKINGLFSKAGNKVDSVTVAADNGSGGGGGGSTAAPTGISLQNGGGGGTYINIANESQIGVYVDLPTGSFGVGCTVSLSLTDGSTTITPPSQAAPASFVLFSGIDTSPSGPDLNDGTITATATVTCGGNTSSPATATFTRDTANPNVTITCSGVSGADNYTCSGTYSTGSGDQAPTQVLWDRQGTTSGDFTQNISPSGGSWSDGPEHLVHGANYDVSITQRDAAGNSRTAQTTITSVS
jgi:Flp pilus assembly pilin Flp